MKQYDIELPAGRHVSRVRQGTSVKEAKVKRESSQ